MKFGQLIEYKMSNIFLEKSYTKCGGIKKQNWAYLSINSLIVIKFAFTVCPSRVYQNILKLRCWPLAFTLYKAFLRNKKRSGTSPLPNFLRYFRKKNISHAIFINWPNFIAWSPLLLEILSNIATIIYCPVCDVINFEIDLSLLINPVFHITKKSR